MYRFIVLSLFFSVTGLAAANEPQPIVHQITGLFSLDREADLRETLQKLPEIKLVSIDFPHGEASFTYDAAKVFPGAKPEQIIERFDNLLKQHSRSTFGVKPRCAVPREKLKLIEISVLGLDCKACCLAAYEAVYRLEGVENATASFKNGLVTAWIDPEKTDRTKLEEALKSRQVTLKPLDP